MTERVGIAVVEIPRTLPAGRTGEFPKARLEVTHIEREVGRQVVAGELARPSVLGETEIVLREHEGGPILASRR